jgi:hypothetical protein
MRVEQSQFEQFTPTLHIYLDPEATLIFEISLFEAFDVDVDDIIVSAVKLSDLRGIFETLYFLRASSNSFKVFFI